MRARTAVRVALLALAAAATAVALAAPRFTWREVELVEPRPDAIRVRASTGTAIAVDARAFAPE